MWHFVCNRCGNKWAVQLILGKKDITCPHCNHKFKRVIEEAPQTLQTQLLVKVIK